MNKSWTSVWRTDAPISPAVPLVVEMDEAAIGTGTLIVEVASRDKDISVGVDALLEVLPTPAVRLHLRPPDSPLDMDNALCRAMVAQVYAEIGRAMRGRSITAIHLFAAAPQAFMMLLGREFKGMPPVQLYEWNDGRYIPSLYVPASVL